MEGTIGSDQNPSTGFFDSEESKGAATERALTRESGRWFIYGELTQVGWHWKVTFGERSGFLFAF